MQRLFFFIFAASAFFTVSAQQEARLLRFPAIYGNQLVFSYAGDLYTVSSQGGTARKLTNSNGYEMFARFSPDGKQIAFTGQYDGNTEVYLMPASGGEPVRLTYTATLGRDDISDRMGPNNIAMTWKNNEQIVYRSRKQSFNDFKGKLYLASVKGGLSEELPLPVGGFCSYSPDKSKLAYNRVFREFRTWKYYKGGMADEIWIYDFKTKKTEKITDNPNQDIFPMWAGNEIYYISDRDRIMNLFCYNTETKQTQKVTDFKEYDIKFPNLGDKSIVFENGGYIYNFDMTTKKAVKIPVYIEEDFVGGRSLLTDASLRVGGADVSPDGNRLVLSARGDVFTVPVKSGITRNLTETSGVHDRNPQWSPDGKWIAYISDATGEDEIYVRSQDGLQKPIQITANSDTYKYGFDWSPDSKKILWSDKMQRLRYVDIDSKKITEVEQTLDGEIRSFNWSPDNRWITYTLPRFNTTNVVVVYNLEKKDKHIVTDEWFGSYNAIFSTDGKYLLFSSARNFSPTYSSTEWNHVYNNMDKLYFVTLKKSTPSPYAYENDEVSIKGDSTTNKSETEKKGPANVSSKELNIEIDFDGIQDRSLEIAIPAGRFGAVVCVGENVYYNRGMNLCMYDLKKKKETELGNYTLVSITPDAKKILVRAGRGGFAVIDLPKGKINVEETVSLADVKVTADLHAEWNQIFNECWRQMRDFFYDPKMHGVDWKKIREKYQPLVRHVNDRNDLNYIIGEMIGELSCGHAYIAGGDKQEARRVATGLLGAQLSRDASGYYRIDKILSGRNWSPQLRSPLTEAGVDARTGDFITHINGKTTQDMNDIYASLYDKAGKMVELTLNAKPEATGGRKILIKPIADESALYYFEWVQGNIDKVNKATDGKVGYLHIPDMSAEGLNEFVKYYYPQLNKKALIIDDRGNGGGNVSPMIIERLRRELSLMSAPRNGQPASKPDGLMIGPKILLLDKYSASDGDLFPYQFKFYKLGKTVGVRSWGGVVGIRGALPLIDGGTLNRPEFAHYDAEGKQFVIEGYGVEPDYVVDNDPAKEYEGTDEQLNRAIELILEDLKTNPGNYPSRPPYPDKSK
ncbi:MAG: PDZ domain-containing protein [Dysgonamonadaceae bacterium]|jgi:tricorn protease|nr:PDZ domain-containing protein [Dysgonamonadaceae bacterium]